MLSTRDGPALERDGAVEVRFTELLDTQSRQPTETFLRRKFEAVFPPRLDFHGLQPPAGGALGKLNQLQLAEFKSASGWLTVGYELNDPQRGLVAADVTSTTNARR